MTSTLVELDNLNRIDGLPASCPIAGGLYHNAVLEFKLISNTFTPDVPVALILIINLHSPSKLSTTKFSVLKPQALLITVIETVLALSSIVKPVRSLV